MTYTHGHAKKVLQASYNGNAIELRGGLDGEFVCTLSVDSSEYLTDLRLHLARELRLPINGFDVILPSGKLLSIVVREQPLAKLPYQPQAKRRRLRSKQPAHAAFFGSQQ